MVNHQTHSYTVLALLSVQITTFRFTFFSSPQFILTLIFLPVVTLRLMLHSMFICLQCSQRPQIKQLVDGQNLIFYCLIFRFPFSSFVRLIYVYLTGLLHNHHLSIVFFCSFSVLLCSSEYIVIGKYICSIHSVSFAGDAVRFIL